MVRLLLNGNFRNCKRRTAALVCALLLLTVSGASAKKSKTPTEIKVPELQLEGGRKLRFERSFASEEEVRTKKGFWSRVLDVVAGKAEVHYMVRPYSVASDSRGRVIITDPGAMGIHIFDFGQQKYKFISRPDAKEALRAPQCVALDQDDNIYVTDSQVGKVFVFDAGGKFRRTIGSIKGGEGFFKRPTGIAVDSAAQRIYVTDTLRDKIFVMDMQGSVLQTIGKHGTGELEFNYPTELRLAGNNLVVVDAMNFRIQVVDRGGSFKYAIGQLGDNAGDFFRPKGVAVDSEGHVYVVEGLNANVQVFNDQGQLLYYFGNRGTALGQFQLPAGLFIDKDDHIFVADSYNHRIQVFHYFGLPARGAGGRP